MNSRFSDFMRSETYWNVINLHSRWTSIGDLDRRVKRDTIRISHAYGQPRWWWESAFVRFKWDWVFLCIFCWISLVESVATWPKPHTWCRRFRKRSIWKTNKACADDMTSNRPTMLGLLEGVTMALPLYHKSLHMTFVIYGVYIYIYIYPLIEWN